jgi:membrane-bound serine protease (ClpP class)
MLSAMWPFKAMRSCAAALLFACAVLAGAHAQSGNRVHVIEIKGAIGVATERQLKRALEVAVRERSEALIVRLDTPGGLVSATRNIIQEMIAAPVPIVVYVSPSGARAASAGTFLVYASHVAAMAPGTNLGAATPVSIGMPGLPGQQPDKDKKNGQKDTKSAMEQKAINDVVALLRSLAQLRGRSVEFAEKAVREAATLTAEEAKKENVIEAVAGDMGELLAQIDGRKVKVGSAERTLSTREAAQTAIEPDWRTRLLAAITDPNVAFILLLVGFYGIILEFWNPGSFVPGTVGAISIILALTALSALPVHYGALALLLLGIALMVAEAFTPGIGILGAGGLVAFVIGSIFLFEGTGWDIDVSVSLPVVLGAAATTAALIFGVVGAAIKARKRPPAAGAEELIGSRGQVVEWQGEGGRVRARGEIWSARAHRALKERDAVRVVGRDGLTLIVEPLERK